MGNRDKDMVEINGNRFDIISGLPLKSGPRPLVTENKSKPSVSSKAPGSPHEINHVKPVARSAARNLKPHKTEPSHIFNRKSVKKPGVIKKPAIKTSRQATPILTTKASSSLIKMSSASVDPKRAERASLTKKSGRIKRFGDQPANSTQSVNQAAPSTHPKTGRTFDIAPAHRPVMATTGTASIATPPKSQFASLVEKSERAKPHQYSKHTENKKSRGLARLKSGHRRALAFSVIGIIILFIAGFIFYQQKTNIELQLANSRSGINAHLPSYQPSGFSIGSLTSSPGLVTISYKSSADGHYYELVQKASDLDSQSLALQLASSGDYHYQTLHAAGQTIFATASGTATHAAWVSSGTLYQIKGNASLSQDQVLQIAEST